MQEDREEAEAIAARLQARMPGCTVRAEAWEGANGYWWVVVRDAAGASGTRLRVTLILDATLDVP